MQSDSSCILTISLTLLAQVALTLILMKTTPDVIVCSLVTTGCSDASELKKAAKIVLYTLYAPRFIFPHLGLPLPWELAVSDPFLPWTGRSPIPLYYRPLNQALRLLLSMPASGALNAARSSNRLKLGLNDAAPTWLAAGGVWSLIVGTGVGGLEMENRLPDSVYLIPPKIASLKTLALNQEISRWLDSAPNPVIYVATGGSGIQVIDDEISETIVAALKGLEGDERVLWAGPHPPSAKGLKNAKFVKVCPLPKPSTSGLTLTSDPLFYPSGSHKEPS